MKRTTVSGFVAGVLTSALLFGMGGSAVAVRPSEQCTTSGTMDTTKLAALTRCLADLEATRDDAQDAALKRIEAKLGTTPRSPSPSTTPSATPTVTSPPSVRPSAMPTPTTPPSKPVNLPVDPTWVGPSYWKKFQKTDAAGWDDPDFFPLSVFFGRPAHAAQLKAVGINTYMGAEHNGPITAVTSQGIFVLAQSEWTRAEIGYNPRVVGWHVSDECEMGYSECTPDWDNDNGENGRLAVQKRYADQFRAYNDGRFLQANFGNGVARTWWAPTTMDDHIALIDASSVDKYLYTSPGSRDVVKASGDWPAGVDPKRAAGYGWLQDQMERFQASGNPKPNWVFVEVAKPFLNESGATVATVPQIEGAVWSAIIHGANGIAYFQHNNSGCGGYALVNCSADLKAGMKALNDRVTGLAPVINSPTREWDYKAGVDTLTKVYGDSLFVFAQPGLKSTTGPKTFLLPAGAVGTSVEVVGENRTLNVTDGKFTDSFAAESTIHIYKVKV